MEDTDTSGGRRPSLPVLGRLSALLRLVLRRLNNATLPKLVPMFICLGVLPVLILFSLVAGWLVWNSVAEAWSVPVYLQYGEGKSPYSELEISSLATNQPYDVSLRLSVPATESNFALGNFMVSFTIHTQWNTTIADVRKPALVVPPTPSVITFLSRTPNLVEISVPLVFSLITGSTRVNARVELGRTDGWRTLGSGEGRELSVYSASLYGKVRPQGLRRILSTFPLSLSLAASVTFFVVSASVLSVCLLPSMLQQRTATDSDENATEQKEPQSPKEGPSRPVTTIQRRISRRQGHSTEEDAEPGPYVYPTPEPDAPRRRRRRSAADD